MDYETSARNRLEDMLLDESAEPINFPLSLLRAITNDFSNDRKIGSGGFADVYKGVLQNGTVAVKKLFDTYRGDEESFDQEVRCLLRLKHKNIIRLLGYCADTQGEMVPYNGKDVMAHKQHRLLCLEYVAGGSLYNYITDVSPGLEWRIGYQIIRGICEGLHYLHKKRIVHLGLKPANILLDYSMVPKICDFGESRLFHEDQMQDVTETTVGTRGYMAPEYAHGEITFKTDIFSLGVTITEILTGQKGYPSVANVLESSRNRFGTSGEDTMLEQIRVCAEICIRCQDSNPNKRPAIQRIIEALDETESMTLNTQCIIEMLNDTESMNEFIEDGMGTFLQAEEPSNGVQQGTHMISVMESSEIMELNILERIVAGSEEPSHVDFPLLQRITENFSEKKRIGVGGCGEVYMGVIQNGVVAVKRLFKCRTIKDKMFHREVKSLITVRHHNIVQFLGYCSFTSERVASFEGVTIMVDIRERLLCFEYLSNGSLERHLTDELRGLDWHTRYEIIVGICKGLFYLHKEKDIIHMDLKPANILLDDDMMPKITDFGLSRLDNNSQTTTTSRLISPVYCAPEYLFEGKSSSKSDIYSLGVIITEVVTGRNKKMPNITKVLRRWMYRWTKSSNHGPLSYEQVKKCLDLAHRCKQHDPTRRPDISDIIHELNEIHSKDDQFQVIPSLEDMLAIEPLEIHFPFELYWQISPTVELSNDTDDHYAFITETSMRRLRTEPEKGIVPPRSKCCITVTMMQAQVKALANNRYKEEITVLSARVDGGLAAVDITKDVFADKEGKVVDEVNVMVVLGKPPLEEEP